ncbi:hypothetical protein FVEN_g13099 [Fusarium venenatum]|nr:hypothetical protein FVEN_g13099 [Fusarium venenatum]
MSREAVAIHRSITAITAYNPGMAGAAYNHPSQ